MRQSRFINYILILQVIVTLCTSLINGYVMKRLTDLNEFNTFPRLRLLDSTVDELSPLPLVFIGQPEDRLEDTPKRSNQRRSVSTDDELRLRLARLRQSERQSELNSQTGNLPKTYAKKSQQLGYKSLKKFNNSGSRNCFFSPVQCLVQFDMNKYKKLVDSSSMRFAPSNNNFE